LEDGEEVAKEVGILGIGEPHGCCAIAGVVSNGVKSAAGEVAVKICEQPGYEDHEGVRVLFRGHG
jgi:hypothetical protein